MVNWLRKMGIFPREIAILAGMQITVYSPDDPRDITGFTKVVDVLRAFSDTGFAPRSDFHYCIQLNRFDTILERKIVPGDGYAIELVPLAVP